MEDFQNYFVMREPQPSLTLTYFRSDHSSLGQINYLFKYSSAKWVVCHTQKNYVKWQYAEPKFMENGLCGGLHPPITFFFEKSIDSDEVTKKICLKFKRNYDDASVNYNQSLI